MISLFLISGVSFLCAFTGTLEQEPWTDCQTRPQTWQILPEFVPRKSFIDVSDLDSCLFFREWQSSPVTLAKVRAMAFVVMQERVGLIRTSNPTRHICGPKTLEARKEIGPAKICVCSLSHINLVATASCPVRTHHAYHGGPDDTQYVGRFRGATKHEGSKKFLFSDVTKRKNRCKITRSGCLDLLKALVERFGTRGSSIAGREAASMDTNKIRTKATHRTNAQSASVYRIVRSCSGTRKGMRLNLENSFVKCAYGANITLHWHGTNLQVAHSRHQAFGRGVDFHQTLEETFRNAVRRWMWRSGPIMVLHVFGKRDNLHFSKLLKVTREPISQRFAWITAVLHPTTFSDRSNWAQIFDLQSERQVPKQSYSSHKDRAATARSSAYAHWSSCSKSKPSEFLGIIAS